MLFRFLPKLLYAQVRSLYLFTFGIFSSRNRFLIYQIATLLGWDGKRRAELLRKIPVVEVLSDPLALTLHNPAPKGGNVTFLELAIIVDLARSRKAEQIFEIGTFDGRTARNLAAILPVGGRVHTLDLPAELLDETEFKLAKGEEAFVEKPVQGSQFLGTPEAGKIQQLLGDSAKFDFSPYWGKMDMVFVDGSHAYEYVWTDTLNALKLLKPEGGLILWHDYTGAWPELTHALNELAAREARLRDMRHIEGTTLAYLEVPSA